MNTLEQLTRGILYYFISTVLTVRSAAPQTALWGGSVSRGSLDAGTLYRPCPNPPPVLLDLNSGFVLYFDISSHHQNTRN